MASVYDPLLETLDGKARLLSWRRIYATLKSPSPSPFAVQLVTKNISSSTSLAALKNPQDAFPVPSPASKTAFERTTAAVNSPPSEANLPAIAQLKKEALVLSQTLAIDELSALRLIILDYENKSETELINCSSSGTINEMEIGIDSIFGNGDEAPLKASETQSDTEKEQKLLFRRIGLYFLERRYVLRCAQHLVSAALEEDDASNIWFSLGKRVLEEILEQDSGIASAGRIIDGLRQRTTGKRSECPGWVSDYKETIGEEVLFEWERQEMLEAIHLIQLLFVLFYKPISPTPEVVTKWFQLMSETEFMCLVTKSQYYRFNPDIANLYRFLNPLATLASLPLIALKKLTLKFFDDWKEDGPSNENLYIYSSETVNTINQSLHKTSNQGFVAIVAFAWSLIVGRIKTYCQVSYEEEHDGVSIVTDDEDAFEEDEFAVYLKHAAPGAVVLAMEKQIEGGSKATIQMAEASCKQMWEAVLSLTTPIPEAFWIGSEEDCVKIQEVLSILIRQSIEHVDFGLAMFQASLAVHEPMSESHKNGKVPSFVSEFWSSKHVREKILFPVRLRFPYESLPFLRVARALSSLPNLWSGYLGEMQTYTQILPPRFQDYENDASNENIIYLASPLVLFAPRQDVQSISDEQSGIIIPPGTMGQIISEGRTPLVVMWEYRYIPLGLFGRVLEVAVLGAPAGGAGEVVSYGRISDGLSDKEQITEIIHILGSIMNNLLANGVTAQVSEEILLLLGDASDIVGRNRDVVSLVLDILEQDICEAQQGRAASTDAVVTGIEFTTALARSLPGRVWPFLARSALLERHGHGGALSAIVSTLEVSKGDYTFTLAALDLFHHLVEEALHTCVSTHNDQSPERTPGRSLMMLSGSNGLSARTGSTMGVSRSVQAEILAEFTRWAIEVFESYRGWRYNTGINHRLQIGCKIARTFSIMLDSVYSVGELAEVDQKITGVLGLATEQIVRIFLADAPGSLSVPPFTGAIVDGVDTPETSLHTKTFEAWVVHTASMLEFASALIRVRMFLKKPPSLLENRLYQESYAIAKMFAIHPAYRIPSLELLETMVEAYGSSVSAPNEEPPSLLGHLGSDCASSLIASFSGLDIPEPALEIRIWNFISAVVSNRQQGMSILILNGETITFAGFKGKGKEEGKDKQPAKKNSIITTALDALANISELPTSRALAMLETVVLAHNFWALAMPDLGSHPRLLDSLMDYVGSISFDFPVNDSNEVLTEKANKIEICSLIAKLFTMYIHSRRAKSRDPAFIRKLVPNLKFYFSSAVRISGYRASLHGLLKSNIESKWPKLDIANLRRTKLTDQHYGPNYVYDLGLAAKILGFHPSWAMTGGSFKKELENANVNLSIIDSQVTLLYSWKLLALELCNLLSMAPGLEKDLIKVVIDNLNANVDSSQTPAPVFEKVVGERASFAFLLFRRLQQQYKKENYSLYSDVLPTVWKSIYSARHAFEASVRNSQLGYFRPLLRILYMALVIATSRDDSNDPVLASLVTDILSLVVAQGAKEMSQAILQHSEHAQPEDLALITAILQAALHIPKLDTMHTSLVSYIQEANTVAAITTLYSWSHALTPPDPIYGEIAIIFLLELSGSRVLAEHLVQENIFTSLLASDVSYELKSSSLSPITSPRLYAIWARGILPLCVNLLVAIGRRMFPDLHTVLGFFQEQIADIVKHWEGKPDYVTVSQVRELTTLVVLLRALDAIEGNLVAGWDKTAVQEGVDYLLLHKKYLATLVVATTAEEEAELVLKDGTRDHESGLVKKVVEGLEEVTGILGERERKE